MSQIYEEGIEQPLFEITMIIDHIQSKQYKSSIAEKDLENDFNDGNAVFLTSHTPRGQTKSDEFCSLNPPLI